MRHAKRADRSARNRPVPDDMELAAGHTADWDDEEPGQETYEMFRVVCPDCARPIALLADEDVLPEHALCQTPWNPFGLTVCPGSGRSADEAEPADDSLAARERDAALLLTLPEGLDWRTQPFSHGWGPGRLR